MKGNRKLTTGQYQDICRRALKGESNVALAREYGIDPSTVSLIKTGKIASASTVGIRREYGK